MEYRQRHETFGQVLIGSCKIMEKMDYKLNYGSPTVVGIGRAGVRAVTALNAMPQASEWRKLAFDTDLATLEACKGLPEECKLLVAPEWRHGAGCGGDVIKGQSAMALERQKMQKLLEGSNWIIVTGGLGGGTGTAGAQELASLCRKLKLPAVFMFTLPFSLEGHSKRQIADQAVKDLLVGVDALICLPNDLLFSVLPAETTTNEAFSLADRELARSIIGTGQLLNNGNLLSADLAKIQTVLRERKSFCGMGVGVATTTGNLNPGHLALENMLASPLLGGVSKLKEADAVIISLTGGPEMTLSELTRTLEAVEKFIAPETQMVVGANTIEAGAGMLQLNVITVKYDERGASNPDLQAYQKRMRKHREKAPETAKQFEQQEFTLEIISRGIFSNTAPEIYNGEDLDIPTWQRQHVVLDVPVTER